MSEDFDRLKARKDMLTQREVESIRARTLEEAARLAETIHDTGFDEDFAPPNSEEQIRKSIATVIRALITQPPPDYSEVAKRAAEKLEKHIDPYFRINRDWKEQVAAIILGELERK